MAKLSVVVVLPGVGWLSVIISITSRDNITKNVHSIIYRPFGLYGRYEGLNTYKQVLNRISVQEITIPNIKM